jgi:hypothetical protein
MSLNVWDLEGECIAGLISQSFQLEAQVTMANLG